MRSVESSIAVNIHWSHGQSMVVKVRDDNGLCDVPLISWPIEIALNSDQIRIAKSISIPSQNQSQMERVPRCP